MPPSAYALVAIFAGISVACGGLAAWLVGPRLVRAAVLPALAAFGALYLAGHRLAMSLGPNVSLMGFEVALPFDVALALGVALATAVVQRPLASRLWRVSEAGPAGRPVRSPSPPADPSGSSR